MIVDVPVVFQRQVPDCQWIAGEQQMCCGFSLKQLPLSQRRYLAQDVSAKAHTLRPSQLEPFVNISTAHMLESTEVSAVPVEVIGVKTRHSTAELPLDCSSDNGSILLSASRVPLFVVATWVSRATAAKGELPLASSKQHHTFSVTSRSGRVSAANHP